MLNGQLDDRAEILVPALATDISRIDAVLRQRARAIGILCQQQVSVVMKITDDGNTDSHIHKPRSDFGDGGCGFVVVHGNADQLRAGVRESGNLRSSPRRVGGIRVRHGLHDDRISGADGNGADPGGDGGTTYCEGHELVVAEKVLKSTLAGLVRGARNS